MDKLLEVRGTHDFTYGHARRALGALGITVFALVAVSCATPSPRGDSSDPLPATNPQPSQQPQTEAGPAANAVANPTAEAAADTASGEPTENVRPLLEKGHAALESIPWIELPSGVKTKEIRVGEGRRVNPGVAVTVRYTGWFADGHIFDNTGELGGSRVFYLHRRALKGFIEGMLGMRVGGIRRLEVPPGPGYGNTGLRGKIPRDAVLFFEIELVDVTDPPGMTPMGDRVAVQTASGLTYWDIEVGAGATPTANTPVIVEYSAWTDAGLLYDTTFFRTKPVRFLPSQAIKGFGEGLTTMKEGGVRRLEIPPQLGYGSRGRAPHVGPDETLIIEVKLVSVG